VQGNREWGLWSVHHTLSVLLLPPHSFPLLQHGVLPTGDSSPQTPPTWVLPTGCSPSGTGCSSVGPPWGHKPCQQTCSSASSSLQGSAGPARSLLQHGLPTGSQLSSGIHLLWHGLQVEICSTVDLHGLQGDNLPHHGLLHGLLRNLCSGAWSTSSSSSFSFTDLYVCRAVSLILIPLSSCNCCYTGFFSSFLNLLSQRRYHRR